MAVPERLPIRGGDDDARIDAVIGNTPMVRLTRVVEPAMAEVWVKIEGMNPGGSIKDRTALGMIIDAERSGALQPGQMILFQNGQEWYQAIPATILLAFVLYVAASQKVKTAKISS